MASSKKNDVISEASPHTIKKFELISEYVKAWVNILMLNPKCKGIVYIDCMSNSGVYRDESGKEIEGTPLLVSEIIAEAMTRYTGKQAYLYFNDKDQNKIDLLAKILIDRKFPYPKSLYAVEDTLRIVTKKTALIFQWEQSIPAK